MQVKMWRRFKTLFILDILLCYCVQYSRTLDVQNSTSDGSQERRKDSNNLLDSNSSSDNNKNSKDNNQRRNMEENISNVKSFIMEKYGRHYRLNGDTSFRDLKPLVSRDTSIGKKKDSIPVSTISHTKDAEKNSELLESGISDVKSIIMEKYGRHYRLTGGSTLATKRNKGEAVIIDITNTSRGDNETAQHSNSSTTTFNNNYKNSSTFHTRNTTLDTRNTTIDGITINKNSSNFTTAVNESSPNVNINSTLAENRSSPLNNNTIRNVASKSDIGNITESVKNNSTESLKNNNSIQNDTIINLPVTKNESSPGESTIVFGSPPQTGDSENNITEEGNLTTITIDLTKGNTSAVIPGLDVLKSPVHSVDVIVGNNNNDQAPKRSDTVVQKKHKKHIVFQISKPRTTITDFANKRKHVPHSHRRVKCARKSKHVLRHHLSENKRSHSLTVLET